MAKTCFPRLMVDNVIRSFLDKQYILGNKRVIDEGKKTAIAFCLPFLGSYSTRIKKNVIKLFKDNYRILNYRLYLDLLREFHHSLELRTAFRSFYAPMSFTNIRVVAVVLLTMGKPYGILRFVVWSIWVEIEADKRQTPLIHHL